MLYYFASDTALEEQFNPYVKQLSVNQALKMGVEIDLDFLEASVDKDEANVILFCEDEDKFLYPNIFTIHKDDFYDNIGTNRTFCTCLEWNYAEDTVEVVLKYIQNHLKVAAVIELWSVWLGGEDISLNLKKTFCKISDLTAEKLKAFYISDLDFQCFTITR